MSDSRPEDRADFSELAGHGGEVQQAVGAVGAVVAWYSGQLVAESRQPEPDLSRLEDLKDARRRAAADLERARDADPQEAAGIVAFYAGLLQKLTG
ncbi:hypothetical protein [Kitasatospora sp. NPDC094016]|uniref:hypothetical protein n=1 Tax=Kitasatospora sp. NPDC094016 TaxID=3154986 RepID=UPI00333083BE